MNKTKITVLSAIAVAMFGLAGPAAACTPPDPTGCEPPPPPEEPAGGNPGNAKPVGNSPWDGITGNSGNNNPGPSAAPMDGQRTDTPFAQPGGKGDGPSPQE
jgi:hypothetical protein